MAHQHYRTLGIVLAKKNRGEADRTFVLYTQNFGRIELVGKSIRKMKSKLKSGIDVFYFIEAEFIQGKNQKILTDAILLDNFFKALKSEKKLEVVSLMFEIVEKLTNGQEKDDKVWNLILSTIEKLALYENESKNEAIFHYFLWNFFTFLGYSPQLYSCPVCQSRLLPETFFLFPSKGGVVCWQCHSKAQKEEQNILTKEITVDTVKIIRLFIEQPIEDAQKLNLCQNDLIGLNEAFCLYFDFLTGD